MLYLVWSIMIFMENVLSLTPTTKIMSIRKWFEPRSNIPLLKKIIWVTGVLRRTVVSDWRFDKKILRMASAQVVETSVTNNSPSQDSNHPEDIFQSRKVNVSNIWNGHLPLYSLTWLNNTMIMFLDTSHSKFLYELHMTSAPGTVGNRFITYIGMMKETFWKTSQPNGFLKRV